MKNLLIALLFMPMSSYAAGIQTGQVAQIVASSSNVHYFFLVGVPSGNRPVCATKNYWMIMDENSAGGKTQISMLLTAYASGKAIEVVGTNGCSRSGVGYEAEDVEIMILQ